MSAKLSAPVIYYAFWYSPQHLDNTGSLSWSVSLAKWEWSGLCERETGNRFKRSEVKCIPRLQNSLASLLSSDSVRVCAPYGTWTCSVNASKVERFYPRQKKGKNEPWSLEPCAHTSRESTVAVYLRTCLAFTLPSTHTCAHTHAYTDTRTRSLSLQANTIVRNRTLWWGRPSEALSPEGLPCIWKSDLTSSTGVIQSPPHFQWVLGYRLPSWYIPRAAFPHGPFQNKNTAPISMGLTTSEIVGSWGSSALPEVW